MGKRYFCDYCDKSFADNPTNRRLHLTGVVHLRNRKAHYDAVRDERQILQDDVLKKPCRTYMSTGECRFGDRCQYSHLTEADKTRLSQKILRIEHQRQERLKDQQKELTELHVALPEWLADRSKRIKMAEESDHSSRDELIDIPKYEVAACLRGMPSLPPSLRPPTREDILCGQYPEWG